MLDLSPILAADLVSSLEKLINALKSVPRIIYNFFVYFTDINFLVWSI